MPTLASNTSSDTVTAHSLKAIYLLNLLVGAVVALVGVGSVPFAMKVESRLAAIEERVTEREKTDTRLSSLEMQVIDIRLQLAGRGKP